VVVIATHGSRLADNNMGIVLMCQGIFDNGLKNNASAIGMDG
jgi:hypothetical protein